MDGNDIDMRMFAQRAGASVSYPAGSIVFRKDDPGSCMYIVQSGVIEMVIGDTVVETCGPNEAIGFMSMGRRRGAKLDRTRQGDVRTLADRSAQVSLHGR
jgi:CRP-like cAMP-binding protein